MAYVQRVEGAEIQGHGPVGENGQMLGLAEAGVQVIVDQHHVELVGIFHLFCGLGDTPLDGLRAVGPAFLQTASKLLGRRRLDEDRQGVLAEIFLEIDSALHIHVEEDDVAIAPDALHLALQGSVVRSLIDLLVFHELPFSDPGLEFLLAEEIVILAVHLGAAGLAGCCGY